MNSEFKMTCIILRIIISNNIHHFTAAHQLKLKLVTFYKSMIKIQIIIIGLKNVFFVIEMDGVKSRD